MPRLTQKRKINFKAVSNSDLGQPILNSTNIVNFFAKEEKTLKYKIIFDII